MPKAMTRIEIINQLDEAAYWIEAVAGKSEVDQPHIQKMLQALDQAKWIIGTKRR